MARRYTYDQPSQDIIGLTHERQYEASIRTGRAPSTGEPDEVENLTPDMRIEKMISIAGTADGRPCYVIQNASAENTTSNITGRDTAK